MDGKERKATDLITRTAGVKIVINTICHPVKQIKILDKDNLSKYKMQLSNVDVIY